MKTSFRTESEEIDRLDRTPCDARDLAARHGITLNGAGDENYSPRVRLAAQLRDAWRLDNATHNLRADALKNLSPREALAAEVHEMWRGAV